MDSVRRVYQQAVQIPMENVKRLWEDYQDFENNLNKITVRVIAESIDQCFNPSTVTPGQKVHLRPPRKPYAGTHCLQPASRTPVCSVSADACHQNWSPSDLASSSTYVQPGG